MARRYHADPMVVLRRLGQAVMGSAANVEGQAAVRLSVKWLCDGTAVPSDFDRVVKAFNTAKIRALEIGEPLLIDAMAAGQKAMTECRRRYAERGRFGFTGPELRAVTWALDTYEAIESASSQLQMEDAWRTSLRCLKINSESKQ